jgi:monoterpene epsilon-lactone hydrolase
MPFWTVMRGIRSAVRLRRRMRGPRRPGWDEDYEAWATALHHYAKRSTILPLEMQRKAARLAMPARHSARCDFERVRARGVRAEWFRDPDWDDSRVLFYLHGGGYSIGSIDTHRDVIVRLCQAAKVTGFAIDYRLAPEHPFPAQLDDSLAAYRYLLEHGVDPSRIVIGGESAGGALTLSTLVALRDASEPLPAGALAISPWVDLEALGPSLVVNEPYDYISRRTLRAYARRFVSPRDLRHPLAAPLYADLEGLPPLLVHAGDAEALRDDAVRIAERARAAGVPTELEVWDDQIHAFHLFAGFFDAPRKAVESVGRFIRDKITASTSTVAA